MTMTIAEAIAATTARAGHFSAREMWEWSSFAADYERRSIRSTGPAQTVLPHRT